MKKSLFVIGTVLLLISSIPIFLFVREDVTWNRIVNDYEWQQVNDGSSLITPINLLGQQIDFIETPTGKTVDSVYFNENGMQPQEIVSLQLVLNGEHVAEPVEIVPSSRTDHSRYYNWATVYTVKERKTGVQRLAIVQRISSDEKLMNDREWRVVWVDENGETEEVAVPYEQRSDHLLETMLINNAGVVLMSMGFYSDIAHFWPSLFFPILYPAGTILVGVAFLLVAGIIHLRSRKVAKVNVVEGI